jgi:UDP-N-acetylmuramoylalanine--D-glutamate ligase
MHFLKDVSVLVVGLGESGLACAQFAHRCGASVRVADTRDSPPALAAVQSLHGVEVVLGALSAALLDSVQVLVMSPGLAPTASDVAALLEAAAQRGIAVRSEVDWFMEALIELNAESADAPKVLAITGTNGKTTVTELTTHVCNEAGVSAVACGNISPAMLTALMAAQDACIADTAVEMPAVWVLELSSFQLHYTHAFNPTAATVLNITQDHLDWHTSMAEYAADKAKVFGAGTVRVLNRDDATVLAMRSKGSTVLTFGMSAPSALGDVGCVVEGSLNWLALAVETEPERKRRKADAIQTHTQRLMPADALRIRGSHNHSNALAALLLAQCAGVNIAKALHGLRTYAGAPNRCELVSVIDDVEYINDSKGTNVGATVAALMGLGEGRNRLVLIAGGVGKGQDFSPLRDPAMQTCKAVITIGQAAPHIAQALLDSGVAVHAASDLNDALAQASRIASTGDAVLLSPACASFDMFKSYAHRAQVFVDAVQTLAQEKGQL